MKTYIKNIMALICVFIFCLQTHAQTASNTEKLDLGTVEPYQLTVTYNKTTHLIFPSAIRYVDLGSEYLIAGKADDAENVLRIKATVKDFEEETNFTVITEDGRFYNFNVFYSGYPESLNYDLLTMEKLADREKGNTVLFEDLGKDSPSFANLIMETIVKNNQRLIKHIGSKSYGIQFLLKGIFIHNGKYYFHSELRNKSNVPYQIDFVTFKIIDKKVAKRTVVQERLIEPLRVYKPLTIVEGKHSDQNIFLLDQFTVSDDKALHIEIFEKNGGRVQVLQVENSDLVNAQVIKDMQLKIK